MNMFTVYDNTLIAFRSTFNHHTYHNIASFSEVAALPVSF